MTKNPINPLAAELLEVQRTLGWMDLIIGSISDAVFVVDSDSRLIFANQYFADMLGMPRVFLYGQKLKEVFDIKLDQKTTNELGYANVTEQIETGVYIWQKNSENIVLKVSRRTIPTNSQTVFLAQDISLDKELLDMKSSFTNLASHQLRTPMTSIMLQSHLLKELADFEEGSKESILMDNILRSSERMISLISDILSITKVQNNSAAYVKRSPIKLSELVLPLQKELSPEASAKKVDLEFVLPELDIEFVSNLAAVNEILSSIFVNALQYTPPHGSISFTVSDTDTDIFFEVKDTGIGIPRDMIPKIFDQFVRADNAFQIHNEGTGLGLYLVRILTLKLGGSIDCRSELNKGSTFTVRLPKGT